MKRASKSQALGLSNHGRVKGPEGLVLAVIAQAAVDYARGNEQQAADAADYFNGPDYINHLQWLDLPGDWRPSILKTHKRNKVL